MRLGAVCVVLLPIEDPVVSKRFAKAGTPDKFCMLVNGTMTKAGISAAYSRYVKAPERVNSRTFGEGPYIVDVDNFIDAGDVWQIGLLLAHALHAACGLASDDVDADLLLWLDRVIEVRLVGVEITAIKGKFDMAIDCVAASWSVSVPIMALWYPKRTPPMLINHHGASLKPSGDRCD